MSELYTKDILRLTMKIPNQERLEGADKTIKRRSRICGSSLETDFNLNDDGSIKDFGWEIKACALGQSSAAVIGAGMVGMTKETVEELKDHMDEMFRDEQDVDWDTVMDGKFANMKHLAPAKGHIGRLGAIYLPVDSMLMLWR